MFSCSRGHAPARQFHRKKWSRLVKRLRQPPAFAKWGAMKFLSLIAIEKSTVGCQKVSCWHCAINLAFHAKWFLVVRRDWTIVVSLLLSVLSVLVTDCDLSIFRENLAEQNWNASNVCSWMIDPINRKLSNAKYFCSGLSFPPVPLACSIVAYRTRATHRLARTALKARDHLTASTVATLPRRHR